MARFYFTTKKMSAALLAAAFLCPLALSGCSGDTSNSTRFSVEDFEEMGAKMAKSLQACPAIQTRVASDVPWYVSVQKVTNLSSDILTPGEQWLAVKKIQGSAPIQKMWESYHIAFVLNAEEAALQTKMKPQDFDASYGNAYAQQRVVTHVITATYRSATRNQNDARSDLYVCQFEMLDLKNNTRVWSDEFLIKRQAFGSLRD